MVPSTKSLKIKRSITNVPAKNTPRVKKMREIKIVPAEPKTVIWFGVTLLRINARAVGSTTRATGARKKELIMVVTS